MSLQTRETFLNATKGYQYGDTGWQPVYPDTRGELFRLAQQEYGGCTSKMYRDVPLRPAEHSPYPAVPIADRRKFRVDETGWVFTKRIPYEGSAETYVREVWVEVRDGG